MTHRAPTAHALQYVGPDPALRDASARQDAIAAKVERARAQLLALEAEVRAALDAIVEGSRATLHEIAEFDRAIHQLFVELVMDRKRRTSVRAQIAALHEELSGDVLSLEGLLAVMSPPPADDRPGPDRDAPHVPDDAPDDEAADDAPDVPSATPGSSSLRGLFRRLAENLHPDKVQDHDGKAARTELMKEVTSAYRDGDLARLLEIERTWSSPRDEPPAAEQARRLARIIERSASSKASSARSIEPSARCVPVPVGNCCASSARAADARPASPRCCKRSTTTWPICSSSTPTSPRSAMGGSR